MRKQIKDQILALAETVEAANFYVLDVIKQNLMAEILTFLEEVRQSALHIENNIELSEGKDNAIADSMEEYGELLWRCSQTTDRNQRIEICKELLECWKKIKLKLEKEIPVRYEAIFLPYKASMWDSLESVWLAVKKDKNWDSYVMPVPYFDRNVDHTFGRMHYEGGRFPFYVPITSYEEYDLEKRHPDVIFIHNPYDEYNYVTSIYPAFYSSKIHKYTNSLVYIPYFISADDVPEHFCTLPGVVYAHKVIVQSEQVRNTYIKVLCKTADQGKQRLERELNNKILALGSPKMDGFLGEKQNIPEMPEEWKKKIYG